jgi:pyruvate dehydrogenase E2 component (dihydrolipoamide acetyltransferase)
VRRAARERGIDLSGLQGTGRNGRITLEDLERPAQAAPSGAEAPKAAPAPAGQAEAEDERVELSRIQRISGPRLQSAWQTIPHVTQFDEADITDLEAFRKTINAEQDVKVTMVALMMKAAVASLKAFPVVNSQLDGEDGLILKKRYHLGFAADTPNGLLVPVIRDVDGKGLLQVASELRELSGRAREGKLKGEEMRGATFTISSLGGIGGTAFTPIINPPEVAILGVSRSATKPVWDGSAFVPRLVVPLSLSYDHRVIDGALAARFTTHLAGVLGDFRRVLL